MLSKQFPTLSDVVEVLIKETKHEEKEELEKIISALYPPVKDEER